MIAAFTTDPRRGRRFATAAPRALPVRRRFAATALLALAIVFIYAARPQAQAQPPQLAFASGAPAATADAVPTDIDLLVGRSTVLNVGATIARVSLTVPDIADAIVTAPSQLLIHGKQPGTISLFVWDRAGAIKTFEVKVRRDLTPLVAHLKQLFPTENITVMGSGKDVVISGIVSSKYVVEKAAEVAGGYVDKKEDVVNLLQQQEGVASNQVLLRVRFAEVSRSAMTELGASFFTGPGGFHDYVARSTTQQFPAPSLEGTRESIQGPPDKWGGGRDTVSSTGGKMEFSDFLNLFIFNNKYNVGTVIRALQERGLFQSLAEPNLIATNGKEASFLAGGEFPVPVVQGGAQGTSVTILFKEFGVRLNFTPTVLGGDLINLRVRPEVSALDFNNAVVIEGFRVPALSTRRTETEVELRDGQTFAIAGLMNNTVTDSMRKIPGIGDIPILGWLFKSKAMQKSQTELVVMITPHIVRRGDMGVSEGVPSLVEPYLGPPARTYPNPEPYTGSPRYESNRPAPRSDASPLMPGRPGSTASPGPVNASQPLMPAGPQPVPAASAGAPPVPVEPLPSIPVEPLQPVEIPPSALEPAIPGPASEQALPGPAAGPQTAPDGSPSSTGPGLQPLTREQRRADAAAERQRVEEEKREAERRKAETRAEEKRRAEQAKRDEEQRRQVERLERERMKREAEVARKNAEIERRRGEEEARRQRALADAALRLKAAQDAYEAEVARTKGGGQ